jgi:regulator of protease activity HflC (stomatin/prohibitin superfamily)
VSPLLIPVIVIAFIVWVRIYAALRPRSGSTTSQQQRPQKPSPRAWPATPGRAPNFQPQYKQETHMNPISALIFIVFLGGAALSFVARMPLPVPIALAVIGVFLGYSIKMAQQWERAVVLRLGKLQGVKGPGLFILVPIIDQVAMWIDQRIRTTEVNAEQALTKDTVPVNVDAIVFWMVHDAERAALEIADYNSAVQRVAQTSLREMIGSSVLSELLSERKEADATLKDVIGSKTADWGVTVNSVEIRDVAIPANLQDAMSRQAQAEREKQARVILGSAEEEVAQKFVNAARLYAQSPEALQLRAMNIIYETTKERGATILMPTQMVDAMNPGAAAFALNMARTDAAKPIASPSPSVPSAGS